MPNWANLMLTKQGKVLQAKAIAGSTLTITKMKLGSGIIPDGVSPEDLTDLIQPKQALGLTAISVNGGLAKIQSIVTNVELSEGYYIRECGVFANDPDVGEIMYAIMTDTSPDFLPSASSSVVISEEFSINVVTENMANITAIIDPEGIVTVANARKIAEDKVTEHNEDTEAHPNDFNLKGITIGKDSVIATKKGDLLTLLAGKGINLLSDIKNKIITIVGKSKNAWNLNEVIIAGDIRYTEDGNGPSWAYLLCKTTGTTGASEPTLANNVVVGQEINDGTVVWTVQKVGDALTVNETKILDDNKKLAASIYDFATQEDAETGTNNDKVMTPLRVKQAMGTMTFIDLLPVGWVSYKEFLLPQHVKANGATVNRSDYPSLAAYATEHNLWTDDPASEPYKYGRGDGSTTMVLPDYRNRVIQGGDITAVRLAGLPNITGDAYFRDGHGRYENNSSGAFNFNVIGGQSVPTASTNSSLPFHLRLDAALSNSIYGSSSTVQPPAICLIPQLKY